MGLEPQIAALVLLAAASHALWNALIKTSGDRFVASAVMGATGVALGVAAMPFVPAPDPASWPFLFASTVIHTGYFVTLLLAYQTGEYSLVYPVARGAAPVLVAAMAAVFAREVPTPGELSGLALASFGIVAVSLWGARLTRLTAAPLLWAAATSLTIAAYTIVDGLGVRRAGSALGYIAWLSATVSLPFIAVVLVLRRGHVVRLVRQSWKAGAVGGLLSAVAYGLVIYAMSRGSMAYVAVLRETAVLMAAVIGAVSLKESFGARRVAAAALIVAGIALMHLAG